MDLGNISSILTAMRNGTAKFPGLAKTHEHYVVQDHASNHEDGGSDELEIESLATTETDTTLVYMPDGAGGAAFSALASGDLPFIKKVYKASDETVNDSATLQDDDDLVFSIAANEVWAFQCYFIYTSGTTPDIKIGFTAPSGATGYWTRLANTVANTDFSTPATESLPASGGSDARFLVGVIINSSTAGSLQLVWAQDTQDASDTKVLAGSWLIASQLA